MACMSKGHKKEIAGLLKKEFASAKECGFKYSLSVQNHSTIVLKITSGSVDFMGNYNDIRKFQGSKPAGRTSFFGTCRYDFSDCFSGEVLAIMEKIAKILNHGNFDESDIMTDYFHVGHYVDIRIGDYDKPYILTN